MQLFSIMLVTQIEFSLEKYSEQILRPLASGNANRKIAALDFISKCALFKKRNKELERLFDYNGVNFYQAIYDLCDCSIISHFACTCLYCIQYALGESKSTKGRMNAYSGNHLIGECSPGKAQNAKAAFKELLSQYEGLYREYLISDEEEDLELRELRELYSDYSEESEPDIELHLWDPQQSGWVPYKHIGWLKKRIKIRKLRGIPAMSKKFGGLDKAQIATYKAVESSCSLPHDILMIIVLLYSQGFKFEGGEEVVCLPSGVFGPSKTGTIKGVAEDAATNMWKYKVKCIGGTLRVPPHHVFAKYLVVVDEKAFNEKYGENMVYGDVLEVDSVDINEQFVYHKRKKRKIRKLKPVMNVHHSKKKRSVVIRNQDEMLSLIRILCLEQCTERLIGD